MLAFGDDASNMMIHALVEMTDVITIVTTVADNQKEGMTMNMHTFDLAVKTLVAAHCQLQQVRGGCSTIQESEGEAIAASSPER